MFGFGTSTIHPTLPDIETSQLTKSPDDAEKDYNRVQQSDNQAEFSHELVAGAGSFMAFKAFEDHQRKEGKPVSHAFAKELLAGFAGAEVDKLAETKGEDFYDREKAKQEAKRRTEQMYDQHYGENYERYDPREQEPPRHFRGGGY